MSHDVPLSQFEGRSAISTPDLLGVFRTAQKQGPLTLRRQIYFNSWILSGLFHNVDVNAQLVLRKAPVAVNRAYLLMQYATDPANFSDLEHMGINEQRQTLTSSHRLIGLFHRRLSSASEPIHKNILTLGYAGRLFNEHMDEQRRIFLKEKTEKNAPGNSSPFPVALPPFVPAHFSAHMMNIIGERLREKKETEDLSFMYRVFLHEAYSGVPLGHLSVHAAGEKNAAAAISVLRAINMRLQEILGEKSNGSYLPKSAVAERRLAEELFMFTKPYREYIAKPPSNNDEMASVISIEDWRAQKQKQRKPGPTPS